MSDVEQQQRIGHLLSPCRARCATTPLSKTASTLTPGWDFPKLNPNEHLTGHFGLVSDFQRVLEPTRDGSRLSALQNRIHLVVPSADETLRASIRQ